ncbi:MAG: hypothetical protein ACFFG0_35130 [Candidatus Thorarchaeota archaeon]
MTNITLWQAIGIQSVLGVIIVSLLSLVFWFFKKSISSQTEALKEYMTEDKEEKKKIIETIDKISDKINNLELKIVDDYVRNLEKAISDNKENIAMLKETLKKN